MPEASTPIVPGLVSVVVPAYRADRFLHGALDSVRRQRYSAWELIVVEDGSEGATQSLVEALAQEFPERRVVYLRHEQNRGLGATRNTAIQAAQGEFVALLDADDLWLETHLAAAVEALNETSADVFQALAQPRQIGITPRGVDHAVDQPGKALVQLLAPDAEIARRPLHPHAGDAGLAQLGEMV